MFRKLRKIFKDEDNTQLTLSSSELNENLEVTGINSKKTTSPVKYVFGEEKNIALFTYNPNNPNERKNFKVHQLVSAMDIPALNIKTGDKGGWVGGSGYGKILSHSGNCWIGGDAIVIGSNVTIVDNALVTGKAVIATFMPAWNGCIAVRNNAIIRDNAVVVNPAPEHFDTINSIVISGNATIWQNAKVLGAQAISDNAIVGGNAKIGRNVIVANNAKIHGDADLDHDVRVIDDAIIHSRSEIQPAAVISGNSNIGGRNSLIVGQSDNLYNKTMTSMIDIVDNDRGMLNKAPADNGILVKIDANGNQWDSSPRPSQISLEPQLVDAQLDKKLTDAKDLFANLRDDIDSYERDIVKLIKYPVMMDKTNEYTCDMFLALKNCERVDSKSNPSIFINAVLELEKCHMVAESNAFKLAGSLRSEDERKKTTKARDLLALALDKGASENEKRAALKQGLLQLEGFVPVTDVTISELYKKVGLLEIEA